jgi:hypothetical protein
MATPLLLLLALASTPGSPAPSVTWHPNAQALFGGCEAHPEAFRGRTYVCPTFEATLQYVDTRATEETFLRSFAQAMPKMVGLPMTGDHVALKLGDTSAPAWKFRFQEEGQPPVEGYAVAQRRPSGGLRNSMCMADAVGPQSLQTCTEVLTFFATHGVPEKGLDLEGPLPTTSPTLLSRTLSVPSRCTLVKSNVAGGRIDCPDARFAWFTNLPDAESEDMVHTLLGDRSLPLAGGGRADTTLGCEVAGRPARCTQVRRKEGKRSMTLHAASIQAEGKNVLVACTSFLPFEPFPPVCNGIIKLMPPPAAKEPAPRAPTVP